MVGIPDPFASLVASGHGLFGLRIDGIVDLVAQGLDATLHTIQPAAELGGDAVGILRTFSGQADRTRNADGIDGNVGIRP